MDQRGASVSGTAENWDTASLNSWAGCFFTSCTPVQGSKTAVSAEQRIHVLNIECKMRRKSLFKNL